MASQRHKAATSADGAAVPAAILDATRASVLAVGVRRTTLTDVARRAGVSRMTVYRLVPDMTALLLELMTHDFAALFADAEARARRRRTARGRVAAVVVDVARRLPEEPLLRRVLDVDPDLLLPYLTERLGATQKVAIGHVRRMILDGHADRSVRRGDADAMATMLVVMVTSFVVSHRLFRGVARESVLQELERMVDGWLRP